MRLLNIRPVGTGVAKRQPDSAGQPQERLAGPASPQPEAHIQSRHEPAAAVIGAPGERVSDDADAGDWLLQPDPHEPRPGRTAQAGPGSSVSRSASALLSVIQPLWSSLSSRILAATKPTVRAISRLLNGTSAIAGNAAAGRSYSGGPWSSAKQVMRKLPEPRHDTWPSRRGLERLHTGAGLRPARSGAPGEVLAHSNGRPAAAAGSRSCRPGVLPVTCAAMSRPDRAGPGVT